MEQDNRQPPEIKDDIGDWHVDNHPDYPGYVRITFTEMDDYGVQVFEVFMCPHGALNFAQAIKNNAQEAIS